MNAFNFTLSEGELAQHLINLGVLDFETACAYIADLPYGRNSNRTDFSLLLTEGKGSCSSKHGFLARIAEDHNRQDIELIAGIFLMSGETHPVLLPFFEGKTYKHIPELHCYLRHQGKRYDFTCTTSAIEIIATKLIREQQIEPHQVADWKPMIHKEYMTKWTARNPQIGLSFEEMWAEREKCIALLT